MAHELEFVDGVAQMAYAGDTPWHGLGTPVSNDLTPLQMQQKAGLDWEVQKVPSFIEIDGQKIKTGQESLVRLSDNKVLTNVGEGWNPCQNADAFDFFAEYVAAGDMEMHTAGSLKGGQITWALAKVKESFDVFGEDTVESFLLFSNPHQYGKSIDVRFTPVRVVCNNTLTMSLEQGAKNSAKVGHRAVFNAANVKTTLGIASDKFAKYKEMAQFLGSKRVTADSLIQFYNDVFPNTSRTKEQTQVDKLADLSRNAKLCYDVLETQPGAEFAPGTWWSALNSVTYVTDHLQGRNAENRLHSQWFGINQTRKVKAAEKAVEFATTS
jgi:phage/plasmid-like protein (TIGR03299 family)|tara:strand:- start:7229 stop:8203 length:975 start_codon:yes stop_codon:yes gene_type:complete